ncbi:hypothetical protein FQA39_LY03404 [Lamprigera yunnana]|nr:hypothetical protein FQA39_LY03404 [Lamprigera yunnana]
MYEGLERFAPIMVVWRLSLGLLNFILIIGRNGNNNSELPVNPQNPQIVIHGERARSTQSLPTTSTELNYYLPGTNLPMSAQSVPIDYSHREQDHDQISLESHVIHDNISIIKTPPPPYVSDGLPTYEEAIRWSNYNNTFHSASYINRYNHHNSSNTYPLQ